MGRRKLLIISAVLNVTLLILLIVMILNDKEEYYQKYIRRKLKCDIAMFGDSNTEGGNWNSLIKGNLVLRKGYSGYTTGQLAGMISRCIKYNPKLVIIQGGGNDVRSRCFDLDYTMSNFKFMADTLRQNNITPVFEELFYRHNKPEINRIIDSINYRLEVFCKTENIDFIHIAKEMHDSTGLKAELTTDDIHLNPKGYKLWAKAVNEYLKGKD